MVTVTKEIQFHKASSLCNPTFLIPSGFPITSFYAYDRLLSNLDYHLCALYLVYDLIISGSVGSVTIFNLIIIIIVSGLILKVIALDGKYV